jgi:hypothetical protein
MVMNKTSAVDVSIQAVSPESRASWAKAIPGAIMATSQMPVVASVFLDLIQALSRALFSENSLTSFMMHPLNRCVAGFTGSNSDCCDEVTHKDLAVADLPCACSCRDRFGYLFDDVIGNGQLDF